MVLGSYLGTVLVSFFLNCIDKRGIRTPFFSVVDVARGEVQNEQVCTLISFPSRQAWHQNFLFFRRRNRRRAVGYVPMILISMSVLWPPNYPPLQPHSVRTCVISQVSQKNHIIYRLFFLTPAVRSSSYSSTNVISLVCSFSSCSGSQLHVTRVLFGASSFVALNQPV